MKTTRLPSEWAAEAFFTLEERAAWIGSRIATSLAREQRSEGSSQYEKNLVGIQIKIQIWGFAEHASGQREFADDQTDLQHVYLIGGAYQV